jgi:hypothetical protein
VSERAAFVKRELEHPLGAWCERDLPGRDLVSLADDARDLGADRLDGNSERFQRSCGKPFVLA